MLGALLFEQNPLGGLSVTPFTLLGAVVVLLPVFLWFRDVRKISILACYVAVAVSGVAGGWLTLNALTGFAALRIGEMGAVFGLATALCWIGAHYLSRSRSAPF